MGDMREEFDALKQLRREDREKFGVECPECKRCLPKAFPKILMPGQSCNRRGHRYTDPRDR